MTERAQNADFRRKPADFHRFTPSPGMTERATRFSQKTADFRPSPGNSSIWRAQETAENRRFSQETADWAPSPEVRHL